MSWFKFNDVSSDDLGIIITKTPFRPSWAEEIEEISIPGKIAKAISHSGIYGNQDFSIECVVSDTNKLRDIYGALYGTGELVVSTAQDEYINATARGLVPKGVAMDMAEMTITFDCQPFAYALNETSIIVETPNHSATVTNQGNVYSEPIIYITPKTSDTSTKFTLTVNSANFIINLPTMTSTGYTITLDCAKKIASYRTNGSTTDISIVSATYGDFPIFQPGENSLNWYGDAAYPQQIEIVPNSRWR